MASRGVLKTLEHRAAIHASMVANRDSDPERWKVAYDDWLSKLKTLERINQISSFF